MGVSVAIVCGLDSGKQSVFACILNNQQLPPSLGEFARNYPLKEFAYGDLTELLKIEADYFAIEPTGVYSRLFVEALAKAGKQVLLTPSYRVRHIANAYGLQKSDRYDPVAIAMYAANNLNDSKAFITPALPELREVVGEVRSLKKLKQTSSNWIGQRLCFEWPELVKPFEQSARDWLDPDPPAIFRYLAGEKVFNQKRRDRELAATVGSGLSEKTRQLADWLVRYERAIAPLEVQIEQLLKAEAFDRYHQIFNNFRFGRWSRANLLPAIYPVEKFLAEDGTVRRDWIDQNGKRSKRNRSQDGFKLYLGLGQVEYSSGQSSDRKPGGSAYLRSIWYQHLKVQVVIPRKAKYLEGVIQGFPQPWLEIPLVTSVAEKFGLSYPLAEAWVQYQFLRPQQIKERQRLSKVAARQGKWLFRLLCG